jgi:hypothetical protein
MVETCVDCGSREFKPCYSETFFGRGRDGSPVMLTLRLCLTCGARFPDRAQLRGHLHDMLPPAARDAVHV